VLRRLVVILPLVLLSITPLAAMQKGELEFALGADYYLFDSDAGLDNTLAPRARFGFAVSDRVELELAYRRVDTKDSFGEAAEFEPKTDLATLDAVWSFGEDEFQPFGLLGLGWADGDYVLEEGKNIDMLSGSGYVGQLGVGCRWRIGRRFAVRVDALLHAWNLEDETFTHLSAGIDFSVLFGKAK
jgi:hypothetical protein